MHNEQLGDTPRTTCPHVVAYSRSEPRTNNWVPGTATWEGNEEGDELGMSSFIFTDFVID